ncbi:transcriptional regulator [Moheibacter sediminis]|nr:LuxR C-terminal-related transcriptional regulator [Moheibacter sediminis]
MKTTFSIFLTFFLLSNFLLGQQNDAELLKSKIEILYKNGEIKAINKVLKDDKPFEPEYILEKLNRNIQYSKKKNDQSTLGMTYLILGNFWHRQANKIKAFENYLQTETIARQINDQKLLANSLMNKSTLFDNSVEKINTLQEASEIFEAVKDSLNLIKVSMNIGAAYGVLYEAENRMMDSNYSVNEIAQFKKKSFQCYKKAEQINKHLKNTELEAFLYIYYGEWYKYEKDYENAISYFNKAKEILINLKNSKANTYCILKLAQIANEQTYYSQSLDLLKESEMLAEKYQFNDYLALIYDEYIKVYSSINDYKSALEFSKKHNLKNIELTEQSNNDKMQILELEKNITENKLQLNKYEANSKINKILIFSSLLIALFIGGISYLIIKNKKRKIDSIEKSQIITEIKLKNQQLEDELLKEKIKFSQEHLISFANQIQKIENFLDETKSKFKNIPGSREEINSLKMSFSELLNGQTQIKQINSLTSELNQDFFFYIRQNYPGISKGDEQLLAYIILNVSSKEISRILNISDKSIYIKRYRLRKKLNLENEETFDDFYQRIISNLN